VLQDDGNSSGFLTAVDPTNPDNDALDEPNEDEFNIAIVADKYYVSLIDSIDSPGSNNSPEDEDVRAFDKAAEQRTLPMNTVMMQDGTQQADQIYSVEPGEGNRPT